jgi:diguanylate cyclase (GGDEF)-like protein
MRSVRTLGGGERPTRPGQDLAGYAAAIAAAAGEPAAVADALVDHALRLTTARSASVFELHSGHWVRITSRGGGPDPRSFLLHVADLPALPVMVFPDSGMRRLAAIGRLFRTARCAVVPLHHWPQGPAVLTASFDGEAPAGDPLATEPLGVLSMLAIGAGQAVGRADPRGERAERADDLLAWHEEIVAGIARGVSMTETLRRICLEVEGRFLGTRCSVLVADQRAKVLHHAAAPHLPREFREAIDPLPIAEGSGACGTAVATGQPVVVADVATDPVTAGFTDIAAAYNLRSVWALPLFDSTGQAVGSFAVYRERPYVPGPDELAAVSSLAGVAGLAIERFRTEQAARDAAQLDPLTLLANRARFNEVLDDALRATAMDGSSSAVLFLDLDGFKFVNDSLGHAAGDRILVAVADRLRLLTPDGCTLARLGGDEFVILVEHADLHRAHRLADAVDAALHAPFSLDGGEFFLSAAVGIALSGAGSAAPSELIRDADAAMFVAKRRGPGRRAVFDKALRSREKARVALEGELRAAVRDNTLGVVYQPILDIRAQRWCGVEALVRWESGMPGVTGEDSPEDFVALAEELGLVGRLGEQVLQRVLSQASAWQDAGIGVPISVNISPTQLTDPAIVDEVLAALRHSRVRPDRIRLEITESAIVDSPEVAKRLLVELNEAGVSAVLDDFGTGHSSIARLADLPVSGVKIDRRFLAPIGDGGAATAIVAAVIDLAHALGLTVTAEGVETPETFAVLERLGCDQAQGFLVGRPASADAIAGVLERAPDMIGPPATPSPRRPAQ